ncbi:phosphate signaling complex protein PhoU [Nocardia sp. BMG111209]|uniref:phosphate signaling complex protein PhoU n=1 Tax=Nocardia sp. BMG111209 TaxID=1160137 RepID=UPI0003604F1C|nr:phosphate signaling complex protein PhoU [Nocardia sp. BMG111209]
MELPELLARILAWLRAGYPHGVGNHDYFPVLAVLGRRLTDDEVNQVVDELVTGGKLPADRIDAGAAIARLTLDLPRESDLARVRDRLLALGLAIDEGWQSARTGPAESVGPGPAGRDEFEWGVRTQYHENLQELAQLLHAMCIRDRDIVAAATAALLGTDLPAAETAIDLGNEVDLMHQEAEREAMRLLTLQSPVAGELRQVVTAVQLTGNLKRMAALATHIAAIARRRHPEPVVPDSARQVIAGMGAAAVAIATGAAAVLASGDPTAAAALDEQDDTMDELHEHLLATVLAPEWPHGITAAVDLTLLGRYYERFADNAVEVGRRTIFLTTGETAESWAASGDAES